MVKRETGKSLKCLSTDNGSEYTSNKFEAYCADHGIWHEKTVPRTPQHNSVAKRINRTIVEKVRCRLKKAKLPKSLWGEAVRTGYYLINRLWDPKQKKLFRSRDMVFQENQNLADLEKQTRPMNVRALDLALVPSSSLDATDEEEVNEEASETDIPGTDDVKVEPETEGLDQGKHEKPPETTVPQILRSTKQCVINDNFIILLPYVDDMLIVGQDADRIHQLKDDLFKPFDMKDLGNAEQILGMKITRDRKNATYHFRTKHIDICYHWIREVVETQLLKLEKIQKDKNPADMMTNVVPRKKLKLCKKLAEMDSNVAESTEVEEPVTYKEAIKSTELAQWTVQMNEDMESLYKNQMWELVKPSVGQKIIGCKWVYKKKEGILELEDAKYKARLVVKDFTQKEGIDYNEIFSPVVKHTSIRMLLAVVALYNLELEQIDVKTTFLHGELKEQIFMRQPEGFVIQDKEGHVFLLKKSLYGLKQSSNSSTLS
ncbi:hypothetical protein RJ639_046780 [Escallonia herrerae]|uniref:Integrase catalytic domain-containing protein n=1 Tax=Escallonia herrerae TaxID=1293975 RepID=A0AA88W9S2_9ASTE|nr:hypothetical protein RJ639_046780 [Escallonia herrerae]